MYGGSKHGGVYSDPVTVSLRQDAEERAQEPPAAPESAPQQPPQQQEAPPAAEQEATQGPQRVPGRWFAGTWGLAWGKFPGIAPGRSYGSFEDSSVKLRDGSPSLVTAVFLTDPGTLRVTLAHGTASEKFPSKVRVWHGEKLTDVFSSPGAAQTFGLGEARDYSREYAAAGYIIAPGVTSTFEFEFED